MWCDVIGSYSHDSYSSVFVLVKVSCLCVTRVLYIDRYVTNTEAKVTVKLFSG